MNCKTIHIAGNSNNLSQLIEKRITDRMLHTIVQENEAEILIYISSEDKEEIIFDKPTIIIRPWNKEIVPFNTKNCIELHIRDLLCADSDGKWGPTDIYEWIVSLNTDNLLNLEKYPARYWVPIKDVILLIENLIELPHFPTIVTDVCGRRPWIANDVFSELKLLWRRANNARFHRIDKNDLEIHALPLTQVDFEVNAPDLSDLHNLIKPINGHGWTPSTPLRISLMECLEKLIVS